MSIRRAVLLACLGLQLAASACAQPAKPEVGKAAPDFTATTLDGATIRLKDLRGKVVFLNLWATWCPPCRQEMPSMARLYGMFRGKGLEIVAVSEDRDVEALRRFTAQFGLPFPVAMDTGKKVYDLYRATGVPETHLIDKNGVIRAIQIGPFDWTAPEVVSTVTALLGQ
jgi:peroxiredoxin